MNELNRQGKPHRAGYVGRFHYSDLRIDGEGIKLRLDEQVARAVNIPKSSNAEGSARSWQLLTRAKVSAVPQHPGALAQGDDAVGSPPDRLLERGARELDRYTGDSVR